MSQVNTKTNPKTNRLFHSNQDLLLLEVDLVVLHKEFTRLEDFLQDITRGLREFRQLVSEVPSPTTEELE